MNMKYIVPMLFLISCQPSPQEHITQLVEEWQGGKGGAFPGDSLFSFCFLKSS